MYVCHCEVVSDHSIREAISAGARGIEDVTAFCGAGGACAGCHPAIDDLIDDAVLALREPEVLRARQVFRRRGVPQRVLGAHAVAS